MDTGGAAGIDSINFQSDCPGVIGRTLFIEHHLCCLGPGLFGYVSVAQVFPHSPLAGFLDKEVKALYRKPGHLCFLPQLIHQIGFAGIIAAAEQKLFSAGSQRIEVVRDLCVEFYGIGCQGFDNLLFPVIGFI